MTRVRAQGLSDLSRRVSQVCTELRTLPLCLLLTIRRCQWVLIYSEKALIDTALEDGPKRPFAAFGHARRDLRLFMRNGSAKTRKVSSDPCDDQEPSALLVRCSSHVIRTGGEEDQPHQGWAPS